MIKLITCDSYFGLFPALADLIKSTTKNLKKRNVIFCEAKISLMIERSLCSAAGGSFNTDVYSFGKYLSVKKPLTNVISKEGSAMAIKRVLQNVPLKCLKNSKANLSATLYDLIIQLKSAKITPDIVKNCAEQKLSSGLKNKLCDLASVFDGYENFLKESGADDQSSVLSYLPSVIKRDDELSKADVYLVGYTGFTAQVREGIAALAEKAGSLTALLVEGDNAQAYVNETADFVRTLAKENNYPFIESRLRSDYNPQGAAIVNALFTPILSDCKKDFKQNAVYSTVALNPVAEVERVAEIIKSKVLSGECRYRDVTIAVPEDEIYGNILRNAFETLNIPYFLDERRNVLNHPLVTLIVSYVDAKRKNLERNALAAFYKNPLFTGDKSLADAFENYCAKYNINFGRINEPFSLGKEEEKNFSELENMRKKIADAFADFGVERMLNALSVEEKLNEFTEKLEAIGEKEESSINAQVYAATMKILDEMRLYLGGVEMPLNEYKNVFLSGVNALELSIIPQYNDAVFIGDYKQTALAKAKYLFAVGLTDSVPSVRQDVALLSDGDIDALEEIKVKVEPKIKVVNHRTRESVALALGAFSDGLFVSRPLSGIDGKEKIKSEVFLTIENLFDCLPFPRGDKYLTKKQGEKHFAYAVGAFADGLSDDIESAADYYKAVGEKRLEKILNNANKEIKIRLDAGGREIEFGETSPTTIEDYFACPYRAFLSRTIKLDRRDEGRMDALSVGNLMHEILKNYTKGMDEVVDEKTSDALFNRVKEEVLSRKEYLKFLSDAPTFATLSAATEECRKYCYKTFKSFKNSDFKIKFAEEKFGKGKKIPEISLNGGKVILKGKIDRVDVDEKNGFFRVLDYKTGGIEETNEALFYGRELQLYLYAAAVGKSNDGKGKTPAGLYYLPISDKFIIKENDDLKPLAKGKTLDDERAILSQDGKFYEQKKSGFLPISIDERSGKLKNALDGESLKSFIDYALAVSDLAAKRLCEGVIVPSPAEGVCEYCDYKSMCDSLNAVKRKEGYVSVETIKTAVSGEKRDGKTD